MKLDSRAFSGILIFVFCSAWSLQVELQATEPIPEKLVVLTFDDSAKSHFTVARPILLEYGFGATFFITEGFDFKDNKQDYMSWDEIAQLHRDGFEIGNHTRDHLSINEKNVDRLQEQLEGIDQRCVEHGIPRTVTFAWPGNSISKSALEKLSSYGIRFARRGGAPEFQYEQGRGFAFEPYLDHPLLIPSAGDARPNWEIDDFLRAIHLAKFGRIVVLQFHGVPDTAHSWVNTPRSKFEQFMRHLSVEGYKVIALRDLEKYVDPAVRPKDPWGAIEDRRTLLAKQQNYDDVRTPSNDEQLKFWLSNMLIDHRYTLVEASAATGLTTAQITEDTKRLQIQDKIALPANRVRVLPYPGGRHPRIGFRDGAIRPQRETKLSLFLPWQPNAYVVADVPEAIWWKPQEQRELLFLAHTHFPTTWDRRNQQLEKGEWQQTESGWQIQRRLPNGVLFGCEATPTHREVHFHLWIENGSQEVLKDLQVQNCIMLAHADGFQQTSSDNKLIREPFTACHDRSKSRWIITGWQRCVRAWTNPPCPCIHSDPQFPDCLPGHREQLSGVVSFYEGTDVDAEFARLTALMNR